MNSSRNSPRPQTGRAGSSTGGTKPRSSTTGSGGGRGSGPATKKPKKRKTPWLRRIISTLILLGLIVALVFFLIWFVQWVGDIFREEHDRASRATIPQAVEVKECSLDTLQLMLTPDALQVPEGQPLSAELSIATTGDEACSFDTSRVTVQLGSADLSVWTPTACQESWGTTLLLSKDVPWQTSFNWNGQLYQDCQAVSVGEENPQPGTPPEGVYNLDAFVAGTETRSANQITIQ